MIVTSRDFSDLIDVYRGMVVWRSIEVSPNVGVAIIAQRTVLSWLPTLASREAWVHYCHSKMYVSHPSPLVSYLFSVTENVAHCRTECLRPLSTPINYDAE